MLSVLLVATFFVLPGLAFAHGGVEKSTDNVVIFLTQTPLSPLVGEKVKMNFVVASSKNKLERFKNFEVQLSLIDTFYGDASRDRTILSETRRTDANGAIEFVYTFEKENFFDIDLEFVDPVSKEKDDLGFLVLPRTNPTIINNTSVWNYVTAVTIGLILGLLTYRFVYGFKITQKGA